MEILKKLKKRICPFVLAVVIFATSVVSGPASLTARAASVAVGEEFSVELAMLLYNIMETVAISSGIKDGLDDYESGSTLYDAFISYLDSAATPPYLRDTYITLADGSSMTIQEAIEAADATVGSNALKLPEEEVFKKYRTISGGKDPQNSPEPSPTPSKDDDYVVLDKFHEIAFILVSAPMLAMCTKFFEVVSQGEVEGVDPAEYYGSDDGLFLGSVPVNSDGMFMYRGQYGPTNSLYKTYSFVIYTSLDRCAAYLDNNTLYFGALNSSGKLSPLQAWYEGYSFDNAKPASGRTGISYMYFGNETYSFNFPFFKSAEDASNYLNTGVFDGLLNG